MTPLSKLTITIALLSVIYLQPSVASAAKLTQQEISEKTYNIAKNLRCLVCDGQPVSGSAVVTARAIRYKIREMVIEGKTDEEIITSLEKVYGDSIKLMPSFNSSTYLLWLSPLLLLLPAGLIIAGRVKK